MDIRTFRRRVADYMGSVHPILDIATELVQEIYKIMATQQESVDAIKKDVEEIKRVVAVISTIVPTLQDTAAKLTAANAAMTDKLTADESEIKTLQDAAGNPIDLTSVKADLDDVTAKLSGLNLVDPVSPTLPLPPVTPPVVPAPPPVLAPPVIPPPPVADPGVPPIPAL